MSELEKDPSKEFTEKQAAKEERLLDSDKRFSKRQIFIALFFSTINIPLSLALYVHGFLNLAIVFAVTFILSMVVAKFRLESWTVSVLFGLVFIPLSIFVVGGAWIYSWLLWIVLGTVIGIAYDQEQSVIT